MRLDSTDRSRLAFASVMTILALPAVWWANEDVRVNRPNVAAVGLAADEAPDVIAPVAEPVMAAPAYLTPAVTAAPPAPPATVMVGTADHTVVGTLPATFRHGVGGDTCEIAGLGVDGRVTVFNPANGQSVECWPTGSGSEQPTIVLSPNTFAELADFTEVPVIVELRQ